MSTPTESLSKLCRLSLYHHVLSAFYHFLFAYGVLMYLYESPAVLRGSSGAMTEKCSKNRNLYCMFITDVSCSSGICSGGGIDG